MLSINTNLSNLITQSSLQKSTNLLNQAVERMSTGYKINGAKDNAANYSISTNMTTKISAYRVAEDNVSMGLDLVTTANDSISLMQDKTERLRALCTQASNGTYGAQSLAAINTEANAIVSEINRIYATAQYNGISLFTGGSATAVSTFAMPRSTPSATEGGFIVNPITYADQADVEALASIDTFTEGANGTYKIMSADDLAKLADIVNTGKDTAGATFVMGADIDLTNWQNTNGDWVPIGDISSGSAFKGTFDGNGHVIKNLIIDNETAIAQGLFGYTEQGSVIKNVGLEGGSVKGGSYVGGLVGASIGNINNCYATATVTGVEYVGGLVGIGAVGSISNSYATGDVIGTGDRVGGLVGELSTDASISNSYATGAVSGIEGVGGLVGNLSDGASISNSYAMGTASGTSDVGGLVGNISASGGYISNSYATGDVIGTGNRVGGLVGYFGDGTISNSYAMGTASGTSDVGGFVGYFSNGSISDSYAMGTASGTSYVGGFVGSSNGGTITNNASVQADSNATQMTEEQIKSTYTPDSMGFTAANGWTIVNGQPVIKIQYTTNSSSNSDPSAGGSTGVSAFNLQVGIYGDSSCQIGFDINFSYDLSAIETDISSADALNTIDEFLKLLNAKQTELGAVQNRLESALDEISIRYENLVSSRSTLRDTDIAKESSTYIQQQILQQASATLLATANQSPSIALQLI